MQQVEDVYRVGKPGAWPAASPTSVLEETPNDVDFMAEWSTSWESATTSPIHNSPKLRSPENNNNDAAPTMQNRQQLSNNSRPKPTSRSLVETLQNCLTSLPQSTTESAVQSPPPLSRPSASRPQGKRRPRASRRTPTKVLETDASSFRDMVQKLTGIPSGSSTAMQQPVRQPVRPRPQRANPSSGSGFIRPETLRSIRRLPPMAPTPRPPPPPLPPSSVRFSSSEPFVRSCKREFDHTELDPDTALGGHGSLMKRAMSAPMFWEQESDGNSHFAMSAPSDSYYTDSLVAKENINLLSTISGTTSTTEFARIDSADRQLAHEEEEFTFSQIESWLSAESMRG